MSFVGSCWKFATAAVVGSSSLTAQAQAGLFTAPGAGNPAPVTTMVPAPDVVVTNSGPATATAGTNVGYSIAVTNTGLSDADDVIVSDTLPAGATFVAASGGGTLVGNVVTWPAITALSSGQLVTYTLTLTYPAPGNYTNVTAATTTSFDPDLTNNRAPATTTVDARADVITTKTGPATALVAHDITYTISVRNTGPSAAANVVVTDTLPVGLTFVTASAGATPTGNLVTWPSISSLAAGASASFTVTVRATTGGSYTNVAASTSSTPDPTPGNNNGQAPAARVVTAVSNPADVRVTKTGPPAATAGQNVGYTITVFNDGPATAASVVVTDTLPAGAAFVGSTGGGVRVGNVVTWPALVSLPAGGSLSFTVTVRATAPGSMTNVAAAVSPTSDPNPANNRAITTTTVTPPALSADLVTTKLGPATVTAGGTAVYTVRTHNGGPDPAANVVITDTLPAGVPFLSATGNPTRSGNVLTWPVIPSLANGASVIDTVTLGAPASGTFTNIAASTSPTPDPNLGNNNGSATTSRAVTTVLASADLVTTKIGPATAGVGSPIIDTITTRNDGPDAAAAVVVTDSLPMGAQFVGASNGGVFAAGVVTWPVVASLPNGAMLTYTVTLVAPNAGPAVNVARSTSTTADPIPGNNRAAPRRPPSRPAPMS